MLEQRNNKKLRVGNDSSEGLCGVTQRSWATWSFEATRKWSHFHNMKQLGLDEKAADLGHT